MYIGILQIASVPGALKQNIKRVDELLENAPKMKLDHLILPELALSGNCFDSDEAIEAILEPTANGHSAHWAAEKADQSQCFVTVGYPESATDSICRVPSLIVPGTVGNAATGTKRFNAMITAGPGRKVVFHCRKNFLDQEDRIWATSSQKFFYTSIPSCTSSNAASYIASFAICMDLNFQGVIESSDRYSLAEHVLESNSDILFIAMGCLASRQIQKADPNMQSVFQLAEFIRLLLPLLESDRETRVVISNKIGNNKTGEVKDLLEDSSYVGHSCAFLLGKKRGKLLGMKRLKEGLIVIDTEVEARYSEANYAQNDDSDTAKQTLCLTLAWNMVASCKNIEN